jgi:Peptidase S46
MKFWKSIVFFFISFFFCILSRADEGMWLLNDPPTSQLKQKYNFALTSEWLEHAQKSAVRFNSGGSGSFVSAEGLIITNDHVGADCLRKTSPQGKDYYRNGYSSSTRDKELKCPDLELNILESIDDVTDRVNSAVTAGMTPQTAADARKKRMAEIEKESTDQTGLRSDVVTLYHGGLYHLYRYKKYTDVRLVFAPEVQVASFGGEVDNFEFPRFDLDINFFRAYENNEPVHPKHFLKWNPAGATEDELVFVIGNPGSTNRLDTIASLKFRRDMQLPYYLDRMRYREALFQQFSDLGSAETRMVGEERHEAANYRKLIAGQYNGLLDASLLQKKEADEQALRASVDANPELKASATAWQEIEASVEARKQYWLAYMLLEEGDALDSVLFDFARYLVRMSVELSKPGPERLREYRDSNLDSLKQELYSPAPIAPPLEQARLAGSLMFLAQKLGGGHPLVIQILDGRSPEARAAELVSGTKLVDPAERKKIADGGAAAIEQSNDSMILLARKIDAYSRDLRKRYESEVEEVERQAYARIELARFHDPNVLKYPDGTFTLRLSYGVVKGYHEWQNEIPFKTTLGGAFQRSEDHENHEPFSQPESWRKNKSNLNLDTPLNFVSNADTYSGNSGSPILNRAGDFVGINFDRNRYGLTRNFIYVDEKARQISVHPGGITETLRRIYNAAYLLKELGVTD